MSPRIQRRDFDTGVPSGEFRAQWSNPGDVFSVLLILGGDVVGRALAQLVGSAITPVAFSFGWVAYSVTAFVSAIGDNKLMPLPDCACKVINAHSGYSRDNASWIIGRIVRDFDYWMDEDRPDRPIQRHLEAMLQKRWEKDKMAAERDCPGSGPQIPKPSRAGLCVSIYKAGQAKPGYPGFDITYILGVATAVLQLGIAAVPFGLSGDWSIFLITIAGIVLSVATGSLPQWAAEKWACRRNTKKTVILTKGNGTQHAIIIMGDGKGLDLEDLAAASSTVSQPTQIATKILTISLAGFWILLLITAAGIKRHTWFLMAIGGLGTIQNAFVAGWPRAPKAYGIPLIYQDVIGEAKVMDTLFAVEKAYPRAGKSMLNIFFSGRLRPEEVDQWNKYDALADE